MILNNEMFMQQAEKIINENTSWSRPDFEIEKLIKDNPLSPDEIEGMPRIRYYPDVSLAENRTRTKKLLSMGVKRGDPLELRLTKAGTNERFPVNVYWNDEKIGELRKGLLEESVYKAQKDYCPLFSAVSFIHEQMRFYIEIAVYKALSK